jgi:response regulator RpfG family c-di-GMP phosphodiesterase
MSHLLRRNPEFFKSSNMSRSGLLRILIVDDNPIASVSLATLLRLHLYDVHTAGDMTSGFSAHFLLRPAS